MSVAAAPSFYNTDTEPAPAPAPGAVDRWRHPSGFSSRESSMSPAPSLYTGTALAELNARSVTAATRGTLTHALSRFVGDLSGGDVPTKYVSPAYNAHHSEISVSTILVNTEDKTE